VKIVKEIKNNFFILNKVIFWFIIIIYIKVFIKRKGQPSVILNFFLIRF
jgi:hypothetical protein